MITYGYEATGPRSPTTCSSTPWTRPGKVTREVRLKMPYVSMIHDIALTQKHILPPVRLHLEHGAAEGRQGALGLGRHEAHILRHAPAGWGGEGHPLVQGAERAIIHTFNARTEGNKVMFEAPIFDGDSLPVLSADRRLAVGSARGRARSSAASRSTSSRRGDGYTEEILCPQPVGGSGAHRQSLPDAEASLWLHGLRGSGAAVRCRRAREISRGA